MKKLFFSIIFVLVSLTASVSANTEEVKGAFWCCVTIQVSTADGEVTSTTACSPYGCDDAYTAAYENASLLGYVMDDGGCN